MKLNRILALTAAVLCSAWSARAQTWTTVLDYQLVAGQGAQGNGIAVGPLGQVLCVGDGHDSAGVAHGLALTANAADLSWSLPFRDDNNLDPTRYHSDSWACGYDSSGNLYSVGQLWPDDTPGVAYWYVRKSTDGGANWSSLLEPDGSLYQYTPGQWAYPTAFAADAFGSIYVTGGASDLTIVGTGKKAKTQSNVHWLVRQSHDGGQTWAVADDQLVGDTYPDSATWVPGRGVFVVGAHFASPNGVWLVRKSPTGEPGTWTTVDGPYTDAAAHAVCGDGRGNIYVAGEKFVVTGTTGSRKQTQTTGYWAWVTRMSADGGQSWTDVDTYSLTSAPNTSARPSAIASDATGRIYVVGEAMDGTSSSVAALHWIVRTTDASGRWVTIDDPPEFQNRLGSGALGVACDAAGNILVTGFANPGDGSSSHWIVRRLATAP
jgi:hypothetical protein